MALATAPGRAAIAVVRLSGPDTEGITRRIVAPWPSTPRVMTRCRVRTGSTGAAGSGAILDEALVVHFPAPHSYTGETVVEVHAHGGRVVAEAIVAACLAAGARAAEPGEFTERAVLTGKLDLVRAEAVGELIDARTRAAHRVAIQGLSGARTREFGELREMAIGLEALIAFDIDFPEEDHGALARSRVADAAASLLNRLTTLAGTAPVAAVAREGAVVVLAGPPNAGKSSLMNALLGEDRVIVSDEPGTTRDAVEVLLDAEPWPIRLVDTAGLRDDAGTVERLGIEVSERYLRGADVVLVCAESGEELQRIRARLDGLTSGAQVPVLTKSDRAARGAGTTALCVSARTGEGLDLLRAAIADAVSARLGCENAEVVVTGTARQQAAIERARSEIAEFLDGWNSEALPSPVLATHLRAANTALDQIIGTIELDDVLARVFSTFCIGK